MRPVDYLQNSFQTNPLLTISMSTPCSELPNWSPCFSSYPFLVHPPPCSLKQTRSNQIPSITSKALPLPSPPLVLCASPASFSTTSPASLTLAHHSSCPQILLFCLSDQAYSPHRALSVCRPFSPMSFFAMCSGWVHHTGHMCG